MSRARTFLVLDIETVPDPEMPDFEEVVGEGTFPPPPFHRPIALGVLWLDAAYGMKRLGLIGEGREERVLIEDFARFLDTQGPNLVTFNGRRFDLPVLASRALRYGVSFRRYYKESEYRKRYSPERHMDLCDFLSEHGAARMTRLDHAARLIGLPGKLGIDGKQVAPLFADGKIKEIEAYCLCDVVQTGFLFLRVQLLRGQIDADEYRRAATALYDALSPDPRLAPVFAAAKLDLLLLR